MKVKVDIIPYKHHNPNNKPNLLVDEMIGNEMVRIKKMNEFLNYAYKKNSFVQDNQILFFGNEKNNIDEVLNEIKQI